MNPPRREGQGGARAPLVNKTAERFSHNFFGGVAGGIASRRGGSGEPKGRSEGEASPAGILNFKLYFSWKFVCHEKTVAPLYSQAYPEFLPA